MSHNSGINAWLDNAPDDATIVEYLPRGIVTGWIESDPDHWNAQPPDVKRCIAKMAFCEEGRTPSEFCAFLDSLFAHVA